jgi:hypothetical protein
MGEGAGSSVGVATVEGDASQQPAGGDDAPSVATRSAAESARPEMDASRRRFTYASLVAIGLTGIPFVWISWVLWGSFNPVRLSVYQDNFYDLQARAMFHGHLSLQTGSLGIEGFGHDGRTYTYFGLFPSLIRMPILLFTNSLDGKLTAPYMLAAWLLTGLFASMLLWRVRFLVRGNVAMGRSEAAAFGVLLATLMGGTVWMLLAANPYVFNEDIAWSICLTIGSIFALLGVIERPSWGRVIASGVFILCANLDRATTGWACAVGAGLIAVWFLFGFGGPENRRWFLPVLAAGLIPLIVGCVVNYSKFGVLFGVSNYEQVWTHVNVYRRKFLAANHDAEEGLIFVPTNVLTYFRPDGLNISSVFPFVTLPSVPPTPVGGVLFDRLYRTASLPASSPLLFLLTIWGCVTAFRPRSVGQVARTRLLLLAAGSAGAALMLWGYIAPRYLGDFVPFFALASYVQTQKTVSDFTGHPLEGRVVRRNSLPTWGPAGQIDVSGNCNGMYISNGEKYWTVPSEQFIRTTWMAVEWGGSYLRTFHIVTRSPGGSGTETIPLLSAGRYFVAAHLTTLAGGHRVALRFTVNGAGITVHGSTAEYRSGTTQTVAVITDPLKHLIEVDLNGVEVTTTNPTHSLEPVHVDSAHSQTGATRSVTEVTSPPPTLCESLIH